MNKGVVLQRQLAVSRLTVSIKLFYSISVARRLRGWKMHIICLLACQIKNYNINKIRLNIFTPEKKTKLLQLLMTCHPDPLPRLYPWILLEDFHPRDPLYSVYRILLESSGAKYRKTDYTWEQNSWIDRLWVNNYVGNLILRSTCERDRSRWGV